jgi:hypothetical protein
MLLKDLSLTVDSRNSSTVKNRNAWAMKLKVDLFSHGRMQLRSYILWHECNVKRPFRPGEKFSIHMVGPVREEELDACIAQWGVQYIGGRDPPRAGGQGRRL